MNFGYGKKEIEYLSRRDRRLGEAIEKIGHIEREVEPDLFYAIVRNIASQQISGKAAETVLSRMKAALGDITPERVYSVEIAELRKCGLSQRKADYIKEFAAKVVEREIDLAAIAKMQDSEVVAALSSLRGIGVWTAEMLLLFTLERPDVLSFGDLGIHRGMRMVYRHRRIDRAKFEKYRRRLSPYGSVASLYFWAVAGGAIPGLTDPARKARSPSYGIGSSSCTGTNPAYSISSRSNKMPQKIEVTCKEGGSIKML